MCLKQTGALREAGWGDARIAQAIEDYAVPGMAPWDWTKKCTGQEQSVNRGMTVQDIIAWGRKEQAS